MYLGRIVGIGLLPNGKEYIAYAVTGRSKGSQERVAMVSEDNKFKGINIGHVDPENITPEQHAMKEWIFYDGILVPKDWPNKPHDYSALVSNGVQTTGTANVLISFDMGIDMSPEQAATITLNILDAEEDSYRTPRILGILGEDSEYYLAIKTKDGLLMNILMS